MKLQLRRTLHRSVFLLSKKLCRVYCQRFHKQKIIVALVGKYFMRIIGAHEAKVRF